MTTEPNATIATVHPKAKPATITTAEEARRWLDAEPDSLDIQRPLLDDMVTRLERAEE